MSRVSPAVTPRFLVSDTVTVQCSFRLNDFRLSVGKTCGYMYQETQWDKPFEQFLGNALNECEEIQLTGLKCDYMSQWATKSKSESHGNMIYFNVINIILILGLVIMYLQSKYSTSTDHCSIYNSWKVKTQDETMRSHMWKTYDLISGIIRG